VTNPEQSSPLRFYQVTNPPKRFFVENGEYDVTRKIATTSKRFPLLRIALRIVEAALLLRVLCRNRSKNKTTVICASRETKNCARIRN
jgi:hypothetical protein